MKKLEIKLGRSVSKIGIIMGIMGTVFGLFWTGMVLHLSRPWDDSLEPGELFLLIFGVMFIVVVVRITFFYVRNNFTDKRPSILDIEEETAEEIKTVGITENRITSDGEIRFCPYCGKTFKKEFSYCQYCGEKVIT